MHLHTGRSSVIINGSLFKSPHFTDSFLDNLLSFIITIKEKFFHTQVSLEVNVTAGISTDWEWQTLTDLYCITGKFLRVEILKDYQISL